MRTTDMYKIESLIRFAPKRIKVSGAQNTKNSTTLNMLKSLPAYSKLKIKEQKIYINWLVLQLTSSNQLINIMESYLETIV